MPPDEIAREILTALEDLLSLEQATYCCFTPEDHAYCHANECRQALGRYRLFTLVDRLQWEPRGDRPSPTADR